MTWTKPGLITHEDPSYNAEPPSHWLDEELTPVERLFVRNNGSLDGVDLSSASWRLVVDGEVERPLSLTPAELERDFPLASVTTVLECAGNGRSFYRHKTDGLPWGLGAVGCLRFEGVRLADLLARAGLKSSAVYAGHESPDRTAAGKPALSRGLPIAKALAPETLVAFRVNGVPLPALHGGPLRIVAPGYPGSAWQKWLSRIWVRDREHDGARMTGLDYRLPRRPLTPGETPDPADFAVITGMPPRALITSHAAGSQVPAARRSCWRAGPGATAEPSPPSRSASTRARPGARRPSARQQANHSPGAGSRRGSGRRRVPSRRWPGRRCPTARRSRWRRPGTRRAIATTPARGSR